MKQANSVPHETGRPQIYERIIIGAGAAGLFCAVSAPVSCGLLLEASAAPGRKLLLSGSGQCNVTHGGDIKDFVRHYGPNGKKIRTALYKANNLALMELMHNLGVPLMEREDGKVFPCSLQASDVCHALIRQAAANGYHLQTDCRVSGIKPQEDGTWLVQVCDTAKKKSISAPSIHPDHYGSGGSSGEDSKVHCKTIDRTTGPIAAPLPVTAEYRAKKVVIAAGGCSFPDTGSDGSIFPILSGLGLDLIPPAPALTPIFVQDYPYHALAGIAFPEAEVAIGTHKLRTGLLLTHRGFSGPAILNLSRYGKTGGQLRINYLPELLHPDGTCRAQSTGEGFDPMTIRSKKQAIHYFSDLFRPYGLPNRFLEVMLQRAAIHPQAPTASLPGKAVRKFYRLLGCDIFSISGLGGFQTAMVTKGGVSLAEVDLKTFECKKHPGLFIVGETLDIDGDTGGYNLQFAFSSGRLAALF